MNIEQLIKELRNGCGLTSRSSWVMDDAADILEAVSRQVDEWFESDARYEHIASAECLSASDCAHRLRKILNGESP